LVAATKALFTFTDGKVLPTAVIPALSGTPKLVLYFSSFIYFFSFFFSNWYFELDLG